MKYIIMCGGDYRQWETPRHLTKICGEEIIARTIRLLRENGVQDISISSTNPAFDGFGVPRLEHKNEYNERDYNDFDGYWCDAFYPVNEPVCYIFGDVIFSPEAIKTIVEYKTDDIMLFGSRAPFAPEYPKIYREPFAFKVTDTEHLKRAIERTKELDDQRRFKRRAIAWELWAVICNVKLKRAYARYEAINDYTCDIDFPEEVEKVLKYIGEIANGKI